uniref:Uncharacterized protein n=1 Tax=Alexandrium catenella TaxID=2925 RepID=A0A7S1ML73_ALECA
MLGGLASWRTGRLVEQIPPGVASARGARTARPGPEEKAARPDPDAGAPHWRDTCRGIIDGDRQAIRDLGRSGAWIDQWEDDHGITADSAAALPSGRRYPSRGRQNTVVRPPPKVPTLQDYASSKFAAECRIARRNLGLTRLTGPVQDVKPTLPVHAWAAPR